MGKGRSPAWGSYEAEAVKLRAEVERLKAHNALLLAVAEAANKETGYHQSCFKAPPCDLCVAVKEAKQKGAMP